MDHDFCHYVPVFLMFPKEERGAWEPDWNTVLRMLLADFVSTRRNIVTKKVLLQACY